VVGAIAPPAESFSPAPRSGDRGIVDDEWAFEHRDRSGSRPLITRRWRRCWRSPASIDGIPVAARPHGRLSVADAPRVPDPLRRWLREPLPEPSISDASCRHAATSRAALQTAGGSSRLLRAEAAHPGHRGTRARFRDVGPCDARSASSNRSLWFLPQLPSPLPLVRDERQNGPHASDATAPLRRELTRPYPTLERPHAVYGALPLWTRQSRTCKPTCQRSAPAISCR